MTTFVSKNWSLICCMSQGTQTGALYQPKKVEWGGGWEGRDICKPMADSCWGLTAGGLVSKSCLTLCDSLDSSPPASFARGIFQARLLEWIAISFSRGTSRLRDWTKVSCAVDNLLHCRQILYQLSHQETWSLTENNKILYSYYPSIKK